MKQKIDFVILQLILVQLLVAEVVGLVVVIDVVEGGVVIYDIHNSCSHYVLNMNIHIYYNV